MKKRISYYDAAYILGYKNNHKIQKYCCNWILRKVDEDNFEVVGKFKLWLYIIFFIPAFLFNIGYFMWNEGLRNFEIVDRIYKRMYINKACLSIIFKRAEEIWSR